MDMMRHEYLNENRIHILRASYLAIGPIIIEFEMIVLFSVQTNSEWILQAFSSTIRDLIPARLLLNSCF